jgi:hypothetical protein
MKHRQLISIVLISFLASTIQADATDFTIYPQDSTIPSDFISTNRTGQVFYGAYYWSDQSTILTDQRNGIRVNPYNGVR